MSIVSWNELRRFLKFDTYRSSSLRLVCIIYDNDIRRALTQRNRGWLRKLTRGWYSSVSISPSDLDKKTLSCNRRDFFRLLLRTDVTKEGCDLGESQDRHREIFIFFFEFILFLVRRPSFESIQSSSSPESNIHSERSVTLSLSASSQNVWRATKFEKKIYGERRSEKNYNGTPIGLEQELNLRRLQRRGAK
jgi:hypothetical protein